MLVESYYGKAKINESPPLKIVMEHVVKQQSVQRSVALKENEFIRFDTVGLQRFIVFQKSKNKGVIIMTTLQTYNFASEHKSSDIINQVYDGKPNAYLIRINSERAQMVYGKRATPLLEYGLFFHSINTGKHWLLETGKDITSPYLLLFDQKGQKLRFGFFDDLIEHSHMDPAFLFGYF